MGERNRRTVDARYVVGVCLRGARMIGCDQQLVVRDESRGAVHDRGLVDEQPRLREALLQLRAHQPIDTLARDGNAEQEEAKQHGELVRVAEAAEVRRQLGRACQELVLGRQALLDPARRVARASKQARELCRRGRAPGGRNVRTSRWGGGADGFHGGRRSGR